LSTVHDRSFSAVHLGALFLEVLSRPHATSSPHFWRFFVLMLISSTSFWYCGFFLFFCRTAHRKFGSWLAFSPVAAAASAATLPTLRTTGRVQDDMQ
jgi:hypothetical protein